MKRHLLAIATVAAALLAAVDETPVQSAPAPSIWEDWRPQTILVGNERDGFNDQLEGRARANRTDATDDICYMPTADRNPDTGEIVLCLTMGKDRMAKLMETKDGGETWTAPHNFGKFTIGGPCWALCIPGNGVMVLNSGYDRTGDNWETAYGAAVEPSPRFGVIIGAWDRPYVFPDSNGTHLLDFGYLIKNDTVPEGTSMSLCRESFDAGVTWTEWRGIPEFGSSNEVFVTCNAQGELVAAMRALTVTCLANDQFCRLMTSISKDGGKTWTAPKVAAAHGRHHPSIALLPDGRMVMSYVVRAGYPDEDGKYAYGVEAIVSTDGGHTWDTDHRYLLAHFTHDGLITDEATGRTMCLPREQASPQATNTFFLPETNELLTIYGTYSDRKFQRDGDVLPSRVCMVKWHLLDSYSQTKNPPKALSAEAALAALRGNDYWSVNYHAATGLPDCGWINRYPENAVSIRDGKWLRLDHRGLAYGGGYALRGVDHLEGICGPFGFRVRMSFSSEGADEAHPERIILYTVLGEDLNKQVICLQFFGNGRMTSEQFGEVTLPIAENVPFLVEGYIDPNARNAKLWLDGQLVVERDFAANKVEPEKPCQFFFGYGSRSISGITEVDFLQCGEIRKLLKAK